MNEAGFAKACCALLVLAAGGTATVRAAERPPERYTRRVAIVLYDGVELLDFAGPGEVFAAAAHFGSSLGKPAFEVYTVGATSEPLTSQGFVRIVPDHAVAGAPPPDVIVIPGGPSDRLSDDAGFMQWLRSAAPRTEITMTVCTGAFVLGRAGLLDGLDVTTWYDAVDGLERAAPAARVHAGRRFIDSGRIVTTAGVSAGIDGALHVVARLLGRDVAERTARYMEYHWSPEPYLARDYAWLNPSATATGRAMQRAEILSREEDWPGAVRVYREVLADAPDAGEAWYRLGLALHRAGDPDEAIRATERASEFPEHRPRALYNLACAHALRSDPGRALEYLARALETGRFRKESVLADPDLAALREDPRFRELVAGL